MSGDYSRWSFDPANNFAEVFKQQGRVDLDSDWNEFVEIVNRRWRAETIDIIGRAVVPDPKHEAFKITPTGLGRFTIGVGRMYVDGLLAECHGWIPGREVKKPFGKSELEKAIKYGVTHGKVDVAPVSPLKRPDREPEISTEYDAALGEVHGTGPVPFEGQRFYPNPNPQPSSRAGQTDLVYLDVWQREVTAVEDPDIREKALGGPDTTTRMQTVWQVKVLPVGNNVVCGTPISAWDKLTAPPAGRLTTSAVTPPASPDPCSLSPAGGYQGLENRLYRVEVHVGGVVGGGDPKKRAKFKWSRDNGSVVSVVESISGDPNAGPGSVVLKNLGRDSVLRFKSGDWVEILDDYTEFAASDFVDGNLVGKAGWLTKIIEPPDEASRTIKVSPSIPGSLFAAEPENHLKRHTRVRRWDQRNTGAGSKVDDATGLIDVTAGPIDIEDGIQVSFSAVGEGELRVGDYWVFAARAATRTPEESLERLHKAPPRGILHHYARLAIVTWSAETQHDPEDCRKFWPPECGACNADCTVTVGDGTNSHGEFTDIQEAINHLGSAGGVVCVGRGVFTVPGPISIRPGQKNVTIRGMGWATKLIFDPKDSTPKVLFDIPNTSHVVLESFFAAAKSAESMVRITNSSFCTVRNTALINLDIDPNTLDEFFNLSTGVGSGNGRAIELVNTCTDCEIERNVLIGTKGVVSAEGPPPPSTSAPSGHVWGRIRDKQGAVISKAKVNLKNQATNVSFSATTNVEGIFEAQFVPVGTYKLFVDDVPLQQTVTVEADQVAKIELTHDRTPGRVEPIEAMPAPPAAGKGSDVRHLVIRSNYIFARQASVFLVKTEGCDIVNNRLSGLSASEVEAAIKLEIDASNLPKLQHSLLTLLTATSPPFHAAGVVLLCGIRVTIAGNTITGLAGLVGGLLAAARIQDNQILAGIGQLVFNGLALRLSGNFIAGILAGCVQAGITIDFASESNFWVGSYGLLSIDLKTLLKMVEDSLDGGLSDVLKNAKFRIPTDFATTMRQAAKPFPSRGISAVVKIHHDVFMTSKTAIWARSSASGDISITDNCFEGCAQAGIHWIAFSSPKLLSPRHLIERNTFKVQGTGVRCNCTDGVFQGNSVQCPEIAFYLSCEAGMVQDNTINGSRQGESFNGEGLIILSGWKNSFRVSGNRLQGGNGHGVLIASSLGDVVVEDNSIQGMPQNGITTSGNTLFLQSVRISGNDISNCQGRGADDQSGIQGAIILPDVQKDLLVHGNRLTGNHGTGMYLNGDNRGDEGQNLRLLVQDNSVDGNGEDQMVVAAGYAVQFTGNQCIERGGAGNFPLVELWGQWIVANGNTVLHNLVLRRQSLALHGVSASSAIATSNILNGSLSIVDISNVKDGLNIEV